MNLQVLRQRFDNANTRHLVTLLDPAHVTPAGCQQHVLLSHTAQGTQLSKRVAKVGLGRNMLERRHRPDFRLVRLKRPRPTSPIQGLTMSISSISAPVLFLDFDGVLHPEFCHASKHFCYLPLMEDLLRQAPTCLVVISSSWRLQAPVEKLRKYFSRDIAPRILGATPSYLDLRDVPPTLLGYHRQAECHAWLWANNVPHLPWLAIDDRTWLFRPFCNSLFAINGREGITEEVAPRLAARLRQLTT